MYCIKCGVKLADTEQQCPLCRTKVYHPDMEQVKGESLYPEKRYPASKPRSFGVPVLISVAFLLPILIVLLCDLRFSPSITWSGYVVGALFVAYVSFALPTWFVKPNPVIFVPCSFVAAGLYLLYINLATGGHWFMTFAFPVVGGVALIVCAVVTLLWYVRGGRYYIFGGASIALAGFVILIEYLLSITFENIAFVGWSFYASITLLLLGGVLIFFGISASAREMMERKFFI